MFTNQEAPGLIGSELYAEQDQRVGRIEQVYLDDRTGTPEWATVNTGWFGTSESFVPLQRAHRTGSGIAVPYSKDQIKDAPRVESTDGHIEEDQEAELYHHYGLPRTTETAPPAAGGAPTSDTRGEEGLIRQEEELAVGKERVPSGRVHLRKYVETEQQNVSVPVQKEKVRVETEPVTGEERRLGDEITEAEAEVTLSEERPVVHKETVAKEKVKLSKDVEEQQETVSEDVRKERVDIEGDVEDRRR